MNRTQSSLSLLGLTLFLTGCATGYPLNMDEKQWNSLSVDERKQLLLNQQKHEEEQRLARIKANAIQRELELKKELEEEKRITYAYKNPQHGNVVMVNILGGQLVRHNKPKHIIEESYQIAKGETKQITIHIRDPQSTYTSRQTAYLKYKLNGGGIYFSLQNPDRYEQNSIRLLRNGNWYCGSNYTKSFNASSYEQYQGIKFFVKEAGSECKHSYSHTVIHHNDNRHKPYLR